MNELVRLRKIKEQLVNDERAKIEAKNRLIKEAEEFEESEESHFHSKILTAEDADIEQERLNELKQTAEKLAKAKQAMAETEEEKDKIKAAQAL